MRILFFLFLAIFTEFSFASFRIKDMVSVEGVRNNLLLGYGLVVGLNGTGDNLNNASFTQKGLTDLLERLGVSTRGANLKTRNIAAVTVTASLPPFARQGTTINISVSTLGDAKSLEGGTLLATPLLAADGEVYAVAQGSVSINQFFPDNPNIKTKNKSITTNGFITNGAIIEKEIDFSFNKRPSVRLVLHNPDISTALQIAAKINRQLEQNFAEALDPATVELKMPVAASEKWLELLGKIEHIRISPDQPAKIIIDEATGTIVMGENVAISPVAIAQGNLNVKVLPTNNNFPFVDIDGGIIGGQPAKAPQRGELMGVLNQTATLGDLVEGLNKLSVAPRDLINILQNIKQIGALQADIEVR